MKTNQQMSDLRGRSSSFAFFGTPPLAVDILDALAVAGHMPSLVVTMPDRAKGRGMDLAETPVAAWAREKSIEVLKPEKLDDAFVADFKARGITCSIVVAYGKIVPHMLLDVAPMYNIHYSLLPRWRGATPVESAILAGDEETGVAIQRMVFELDAGPIVALEKTPIGADENVHELRTRLNAMAARMLVMIMPQLLDGSLPLVAQDESLATHAGKMSKEDGLLDLSDDGFINYRKYRAYFGWPGTYAYFERNGKRIRGIVTTAHLEGSKFVIDTIKPAGKGEMPYADFARSGARPVA